jgi:iron(III) transport system ATP-binding protein
MFMADRIALMRDGRLLQTGTPAELYCSPASPFVASFFGEVNELEATVHAGRVETALGAFDAADLADGSAVRVLIRPEAIDVRITAGGSGGVDPAAAAGRVVMSRLLGRNSLLHLSVRGSGGTTHHVHALVPGVFLPAADDPVELHVDASRAFVFPAGAD